MVDNDAQHIVEVIRHATRQQAYGFNLLGLLKLGR
jgi:hypothetical protein